MNTAELLQQLFAQRGHNLEEDNNASELCDEMYDLLHMAIDAATPFGVFFDADGNTCTKHIWLTEVFIPKAAAKFLKQ